MVGANLKGGLTEHQWFDAVRRWRVSGLSQAAFCKNEGLAPWRFSTFKRSLALAEAEAKKTISKGKEKPKPGKVFIPVEFAGVDETDDFASPWSEYQSTRIIDHPKPKRRGFDNLQNDSKIAAEILLSGWQIRIHAGADYATLKNLLRALLEY